MSQKEVYQFNVPTFGRGVVFDVGHQERAEQFRFFSEALKTARLQTYVELMVVEAEAFFAQRLVGESGEVRASPPARGVPPTRVAGGPAAPAERPHHPHRQPHADGQGGPGAGAWRRRDAALPHAPQLFEKVSDLFHDLDMGMQPISLIFPHLPIAAHRRRDASRKELSGIFTKVIRARVASGVKGADVLQCFIDAQYKDGRKLTEDQITGMLIAVLFAGQHTSSITSTWTGLFLMSSPEWQAKCEAEQKAVRASCGEALTFDSLSKMDTLHVCIKEALRLHPPLIMLMRLAHEDFSVTDREGRSFTVPKGDIVATSPTFSHRLEHVWKAPETYNPARHLEGSGEGQLPFSFVGFGGGRHGCMGETFAYMQIKTIWAYLLRNFEFKLLSPFPEPDYAAMVVGPKAPTRVSWRRRKL